MVNLARDNLKEAIGICKSFLITERGRKLLTLLNEIQENEDFLAREKVEIDFGYLTLEKLRVDTSKPRNPKTVEIILGLLPEEWRYYCTARACACSGCCNRWVTEEEYNGVKDKNVVTVKGDVKLEPLPNILPDIEKGTKWIE